MSKRKTSMNDDVEEDEGDPLMASFADMMTLLLGFFMILYSLSFDDEKKFYEFGKAISSSFSRSESAEDETSVLDAKDYKREARAFQMLAAVLNLGDPQKALSKTEDMYLEMLKEKNTKESIKNESQEIKQLQAKVRQHVDESSNVIVEIDIPSEKIFSSGSSILIPQTRKKIQELAQLLTRVDDSGVFNIVGHTDSRPMRNGKDNWSLSAERATSVAKALIQFGVPEDKIYISAKAGTDPLFPEYNSKGEILEGNMMKNRRIQIIVERVKGEK